ncbi:hypothetical protein F5887DRAFT_1270081 [Amanita rubescens]|nr:hypothetical protein F5887DRAFT_1270081 [Amanita rubescens]
MFAPLLFPVRHRKQVSIGGPPKAVLGGPQRKPSPLPPSKPKKVQVNLPLLSPSVPPLPTIDFPPVTFPESSTRDIFPPDVTRNLVPHTIDVFLPGQHAWDVLRQQVIEEKLVQLGVERGSGSTVPHIYAPHARAASISSPADPALLLFKLNKLHLQQQQQQQHDGLLSPALSSPQPPFMPSPHFLPMVPPRHAHTMSLAQPPIYHPMPYHTALSPAPRPPAVVPQPRYSPNSLALLRIRPDFVRGFGLETPEEADEEEEQPAVADQPSVEPPREEPAPVVLEVVDDQGTAETATATVADTHSRTHSRHQSKFSTSLSVPSRIRTPLAADVTADLNADDAGEWTGSEDLYLSDSSDSESIGEWSNPSDEERARRERAQRRIRRRQQLSNKPRRLPNFPKPPEEPSAARLSMPQSDRDEDIMSNPSEEYLAVAAGNFYASRSPNCQSLPLPLKHSRSPSAGQYSAHDPAQAHSRTSSDTFGVHYQQHLQEQQTQLSVPTSAQPTLNPFAKPFVFGVGRPSQHQQQQHLAPPPPPPNAPLLSHSPLPSIGSSAAHVSISSIHSLTTPKPLNVSAPEFKPGGFTFRPPPGVPQMPTLQIPTDLGLGLGLGPTADGGWGIGGSVSPGGLFTRPLPSSSSEEMREQQGREKRQRRNSSSGDVGNIPIFDEGDSLRSFRFPANVDSPKSLRSMRRSMSDASVHHRVISSDKENRGAELFSYAAFATVAAVPYVPLPKEDDGEEDMEVEECVNGDESTFADDSTAKNDTRRQENEREDENENDEGEGASLFRSKKRPPLPLDFKQETTRKNTVPAGLFKALANVNGNREGEERTRKTVRSRLSSRDFYDEYRKPSLDDINVPRISNALSSRNLFTTGLFASRNESETNGEESASEGYQIEKPSLDDDNDVFSTCQQQQQHKRRGSSLPDDLHDMEDDGDDRVLVESPGLELTTRDDMHDFEERLVSLIEDRFGVLERSLGERRNDGMPVLNSKTEAMIADMVSLFRVQLQENAVRSLEDSQMDARGEMDFQLIKDIVDQGHKELAGMLRKELIHGSERQPQVQYLEDTVVRSVEDVCSRTINAIMDAMADLAARQEAAVNRVASAPVWERDALVEKLVGVFSPMLQQHQQQHQQQQQAPRVDPIDYEFLTSQLAQAVKPHISQLIDLAADKRETASLIVDQILPMLPVQTPALDMDALTIKLTTEVRRAIAPIDAHEIKEQVADLVIERLDSRLAVRDKAFSVDVMAARVAESVTGVVEGSITKIRGTLDKAVEQRTGVEELSLKISELPAKLAERLDGLADAQDKIMSHLDKPTSTVKGGVDESIAVNLEQLLCSQKKLEGRDEELLTLNKEILDKLLSLPDVLVAASNVLSDTHSELVSSVESSRREVDELRKLNAEYQVQVVKARSAHGQVRVEKDAVSDKLASAEADRDRLRAQFTEAQTEKAAHATEIMSLKIRNVELEEALSQALARFEAADVSAASTQQRLAGLEQTNHDLSDEKQDLQATVESLNMQLNYSNRDKEAATLSLEQAQKQNEELLMQQGHWDSLRHAAEKIDTLTNLIGQADNDELKELRLARDRTKDIRGGARHDAENKASNSDRTASTVRQTLAQAQQRSSEWERRTREAEGQLELTQTRLEQAEQTQAQMETDLSLVKLQLEEREAEDRLAKDREVKLRDHIAALEAKVARIQIELEQAKTPKLSQAAAITVAPSPFRAITNGGGAQSDSRARAVYNMRSPTPNPHPRPISQSSFNSATPPSGTVWDSMHAPRQPYPTPSTHLKKYPYLGPSSPRGQYNTHNYHRPAAPSPTPSVVSVTPTQREDGWWS